MKAQTKYVSECPPGKICKKQRYYSTSSSIKTVETIALIGLIVLLIYVLGFLPLVYQQYQSVFLILIITGIYVLTFHLYIVIGKRGKTVCDNSALDLWSIEHYLGHLAICVFLVNPIGFEIKTAILITIMISIAWELFEEMTKKRFPNFACESALNHLVDIVLDTLGALTAIFFI
jgi:hypothetical protein